MPSPYVKKLATELGISQQEVEGYWNKAKALTVEELGTTEAEFGKKEYAYTTGIVKKMLGVSEDALKPDDFLESELGADDFIETLVSGQFNIGNVTVSKDAQTHDNLDDVEITKDEDEDDEEKDEDLSEAEGDEEDDDEDEDDDPEDDEDDDDEDEDDDEDMEEKASTKTAKCPDCGTKYLVATGYCVSCKKKVAKTEDTDESEEEDVIPAKSMDDIIEDIVQDKA